MNETNEEKQSWGSPFSESIGEIFNVNVFEGEEQVFNRIGFDESDSIFETKQDDKDSEYFTLSY